MKSRHNSISRAVLPTKDWDVPKTKFVEHKVLGSTVFSVPSLYHSLKPVGMGAYGLVCSSLKKTTGNAPCAIKKIAGYSSLDNNKVVKVV